MQGHEVLCFSHVRSVPSSPLQSAGESVAEAIHVIFLLAHSSLGQVRLAVLFIPQFRAWLASCFIYASPHRTQTPCLFLSQAFPMAAFTPFQSRILKHCRKIGLAYQLNERSPVIYPTQLALLLARESAAVEEKDKVRRARAQTGDARLSRATQEIRGSRSQEIRGSRSHFPFSQQGFLLIETNFRLYATTGSELKIALLFIFADIVRRGPSQFFRSSR